MSEKHDTIEQYTSCLKQQISEFELLKSMYPNYNDVVLSDNNNLEEIQNFLIKPTEYIPKHLDFTINLLLYSMKLEVCIDLPSLYPEKHPNLNVRCNQLNHQQETQLNSELSNYIQNNHLGEVCLYNAINWLQENIEGYISSKVDDTIIPSNTLVKKYVRLWIYSHHIYNKKKREEIVKQARHLNLLGFCLSGKPGIICIEGPDSDCYDWWKNIKSMNWKKIAIRKTEDLLSPSSSFVNFEEIQLNMSDFSKYMYQIGLNDAFNEIFGLINES